jgi:thioredoxin 1
VLENIDEGLSLFEGFVMSQVIVPATEAEARAVLGSDGTPVLVDFYAEWCGPCKAFAPTLERFAADRQDRLRVMKLDVDEFTGIAGEVGIRSVPTLLLVSNGQVLAARSGALSAHALAAFVDNAVG